MISNDYKPFAKIVIPPLEETLTYDEEHLEALNTRIIATDKQNKEIYKHNYRLDIEWIDYFDRLGLQVKDKKGKRTALGNKLLEQLRLKQGIHSSIYSWNISEHFYFNQFKYKNVPYSIKDFNLSNLREYKDYINAIKHQIEQKQKVIKAKADAEMAYITKAQELGVIASEYEDIDSFKEAVREKAIKKYLEDNYPDGEEIYIKCCDYCDSWTVGEHRCSCGNRRIELEIDSSNINDIYAYPQPY